MTSRPDRKLVRRLKQREEEAFTEMVRRYQDQVISIIHGIVGDREEAREVAQEVFIAVFKYIDSFRGDAKFSTWLFRIASNRAKNRIKYLARRNHRQHQGLDDTRESRIESNPAGGGADPRPDESAQGRELADLVQEGLEELAPKYREIIVLRDVEDLSYADIAETLDVAEGTVKSRLYRARSKLKDYIDARYDLEDKV